MRPSPSIIRYYFNSRPHGGRPPPLPFQRAIGHFNSRPHGGRRCPRTVQVGRFKFQLTPSRRATTRTILPATPRLHFNSRPHGGRPLLTIVFVCSGISTHALTEGDFILKYQDNIRFLFQLTPSRRATQSQRDTYWQHLISTHALTEGDGKFRQIFLLNRGYAYSISLYFLPHFISLLPQILSFQQKSFKFQVRIFLLFSVHLAFALQNQCVHHVKYRFCTNMFYFVFVLFTQIVKPQTIGLFIYDFF